MEIGSEDEFEIEIVAMELPVVLVDEPERSLRAVMPQQHRDAPVGDPAGIVAADHRIDLRHRTADIGVLVVGDEPANVVERDDLFDLAQGLGPREGGAWVEQHRLVAALE